MDGNRSRTPGYVLGAVTAAAIAAALAPGGASAQNAVCWNEYRETARWQRVGHPGKGPVQARKIREGRRICGQVAQGAWRPVDRTRTADRDR